MKIRLFMNDYLDIYVDANGRVYVEIGTINKGGETISENSYANSSFSTYMKYLGIDVKENDYEIVKYLSGNNFFIRIRRNKSNNGLQYGLHDVENKEELIVYDRFDDLIETEVLQKEINVSL